MPTFSDRIINRTRLSGSKLVVGIDPRWESLPEQFRERAWSAARTPGEAIASGLTSFYCEVLERVGADILAIKPNIAFFEQYGVSGLSAYAQIVGKARTLGIPTICDGKRGDIGSTAEAYTSAYLAPKSIGGWYPGEFEVDALTVNPFLGPSSLEPFLDACKEHGKGIFVLLRTSNADSALIQGRVEEEYRTRGSGISGAPTPANKPGQMHSATEILIDWLQEHLELLQGETGFSGLGVVIGATLPQEAKILRSLIPKSLFLVPGLGAQGASATAAMAGATHDGLGVLINVSRSLFSFSTPEELTDPVATVAKRVTQLNRDLT